jgi:hypothetical protein
VATKHAGELTDLLLYRTRSTGGIPFSKTFAMSILSLSQSLTQAYMKRLIKDADLTLSPEKPVYDTTAEFTDLYQITGIDDDNIQLAEAKDWREMSRINSHWLRAHAQRPNTFCQIGARFLGIYPTPLFQRTIGVSYIYETTTLDEDDHALELPDEDVTFCLDLAETVLLLSTARGEKLTEAAGKIQQFVQRVGNIVQMVQEERDL